MYILGMIVALLFATEALAANPSGATKVAIKWDGNYSYNKATLYDAKHEPHWIGNIRAGHSRNFQNGAAQEAGVVAKDGSLEGWLWRPQGDGPFPFVIFLHGCGGINHTHRWAADMAPKLNSMGIGLLSLDSFTTRHIKQTCGFPGGHWMRRRTDDAYSALDYLVDNKLAKRDEVYLMGHSGGASATLIAMEERYLERKNRFAAGIPLEPTCRTMTGKFYGPIYMLLAELDEWTDNKFCLRLAREKRDRNPIQITTIKGTHHGYLFPGAQVHISSSGLRFGHDPVGSLVGNELLLVFFKSPKVENKIETK